MSTSTSTFGPANPIIHVSNVVETATYYQDMLGFDVAIVWGNPPYYACVCRGEANLEFARVDRPNVGLGQCYIFVQDPDLVHDEYKARGVEVLCQPKDRDYGMRDFRLKDINGHILIFGRPNPQKAELWKAGASKQWPSPVKSATRIHSDA